jgi:hypothetical protein
MTKLRENVPTGEEAYISRYDELQLTDFSSKVTKLFENAAEKGYTNLYFTVESTTEPYEPYPGDAQIVVYGTRPMNEEELRYEKQRKELDAFAKQKGITPYEAEILLSLQSRGKV